MKRLLAGLCLSLWLVCRLSAGSDITTNATVSDEFDLPSSDDNFKTSPPEGPDSTTLIGGVISSPLVPPDSFQKWATNLPPSARSRHGFSSRPHRSRIPFGSPYERPNTRSSHKTCQYIFTVQDAADCTHTSTEIAVHHASRKVLPSQDDLGELSRRLQRLEKAVYGAAAPSRTEELQRDGVSIAEVNIRDREVPDVENGTTERPGATQPTASLVKMAQGLLKQLSALEIGIIKSEKEKGDLRTQNKHLLSTLRRSAAARRNFLTLKTNLENSLRNLREENSRLLSANSSAAGENEVLQYRVEKLVALQESSRKTIRSMEVEKIRIKAGALQCERKVKGLMRTTGQLKERLRNMTSTVQRCVAISSEDESRLYKLEKERERNEALAEENLELKDELENATRQIEELTEALKREKEGATFGYVLTERQDEQDFAHCGRITAISQPETIRVTLSNLEKSGVWMMDPLEALGEGKVWSLTTVKYKAKELKQYRSLRDFVLNRPERLISLPVYAESNGAVVYNGSFYYQRRNSRKLIKFDLRLRHIVRERAVHHAGFHATFAYRWGGLTDIDLAVDEFGLWVIYSTRQNNGNIVLSRLNPDTLRAMMTAKTTIPKRAVANAFMACGILYTVDSYNAANASLNYEYDTFRRRSKRISIPISNQHRYNVMIDYNPRTREIFSWDNSCQVRYYASLDKSIGEIAQLSRRSGRRRRRRA